MAVNKVVFDGEPIIDLTGDSVTPEKLLNGETAHNAAGEAIVGTYAATGGGTDMTQLYIRGRAAAGGPIIIGWDMNFAEAYAAAQEGKLSACLWEEIIGISTTFQCTFIGNSSGRAIIVLEMAGPVSGLNTALDVVQKYRIRWYDGDDGRGTMLIEPAPESTVIELFCEDGYNIDYAQVNGVDTADLADVHNRLLWLLDELAEPRIYCTREDDRIRMRIIKDYQGAVVLTSGVWLTDSGSSLLSCVTAYVQSDMAYVEQRSFTGTI